MLQIGTVLQDRYRLISPGISQDLGTIYKAYDMQRDRLVVVLVLAFRLEGRVEVWDRLTRAQQAVADLAQPGLVPFEQIGIVDGQGYLVRSQVEGQTLADLLAQAGRLEAGVAVEIAIRLCQVLTPAHRVGLVHGSLSPHSIWVGDDGQIAVTDAGLLPALRSVSAPPGQPWGRFPYLSPEQAAGEEVHPASDVYVVGSLLYEMLAGRPPFRTPDRTVLVLQHLRQEPPSLQILLPQIPVFLAQIVHKALAKEPAARYRNAGQLAHILTSQFGSRLPPRLPELAPPHDAPVRGHLVVPPPPMPSPSVAAPPFREIYAPSAEAAEWDEEPEGVDWLMIGLIIMAMIAVLGLIPLWRAVNRRYAVPPPAPTPLGYHLPEGDVPLSLPGRECRERQASETAELDDFRVVCYNLMSPRIPPVWIGSADGSGVGQSAGSAELSACGVQLTGLGAKL